jgi:hypothetical protein
MKTKIDIRKMLQGGKKATKSNSSFDKGLIGLGIKINTLTEHK